MAIEELFQLNWVLDVTVSITPHNVSDYSPRHNHHRTFSSFQYSSPLLRHSPQPSITFQARLQQLKNNLSSSKPLICSNKSAFNGTVLSKAPIITYIIRFWINRRYPFSSVLKLYLAFISVFMLKWLVTSFKLYPHCLLLQSPLIGIIYLWAHALIILYDNLRTGLQQGLLDGSSNSWFYKQMFIFW